MPAPSNSSQVAPASHPARARSAGFLALHGVYYLALGTWFGATVMMGLAAGLTFRTIRAQPLILTQGPASAPGTPLAERAHDFLAGNVVNAAFGAFTVVQLVCGVVLLIALVAQLTLFRARLRHAGKTWPNALRVACIALGLALFAVDLAFTRPVMASTRDQMYHHGPVSDEALAELEASFDRLHERSSRSMGIAALVMAAAALVSPFAFTAGSFVREDHADG